MQEDGRIATSVPSNGSKSAPRQLHARESLQAQHISLFAGVGIVKGSVAETEWQVQLAHLEGVA